MAFFGSSNPDTDFEDYDRQQSAAMDRLPVCDFCGRPIQDDHYYEIGADTVCESCLNINFRKDIE